MILSFKHKGLEEFYKTGSKRKIQANHAKRLRFQLTALDTACTIDDCNLPGYTFEFILETYLKPLGIEIDFLAKDLDVTKQALNQLIQCKISINPDISLRLAKALGRSPESWLLMQDCYNLWQAKKSVNLTNVRKVLLVSNPS